MQLGLYEGELNEKVSTTNLLKVHSFKAIVLKLQRISAEQRKDISFPSEKMTSTEKVSSSLSSNRLEGDVFGPVNAPTKSESDVTGPVNASTKSESDVSGPVNASTKSEGDVSGPVNASTKSESDVSGPVNAFSPQSDSSRFWRKIADEQTSYVLNLTKDLVENDSVKREIVWE